MIWTDLSTAPAIGTEVAEAKDVVGAKAITVRTTAGEFPMLLVRTGEVIKAYVNICPHQFLPLDYRGTQLLSRDGTKLLCSAHGAMFDVKTGVGIAGEGLGSGLIAVPITQSGAQIIIG